MSQLDYSVNRLADAIGVAAGKWYLGNGRDSFIPQESIDGSFAVVMRSERKVYINDGAGTVGYAILDQSVKIPYVNDPEIARANKLVELERRNGELYVIRIARESIRESEGETVAEQRDNAMAFVGKKRLAMLRLVPTGGTLAEVKESLEYINPFTGVPSSAEHIQYDPAADIAALASGQHRLALPYLDTASGETGRLLSSAASAGGSLPARGEFQLGEVLTLAQGLPSGAIALCPIYLYADQAELVEADFLRDYDLRPWLAPQLKHKLNATAAPTTSDDAADGYGVGSLWLDLTNAIAYICLDATPSAAAWGRITGGAGTGDFLADGSVPMTGDLDLDGNSLNNTNTVDMIEGSAPSTPASGHGVLYEKTDKKIYFKNDAGTEFDLTDTGAGSGNTITTDIYANLPAAGNAGDVYKPTDGYTEFVDDGTSWLSRGPSYPLTNFDDPAAPAFSWINQGGATITLDRGALVMYDISNGSNNLRAYKRAAPSTPYTVTIAMLPTFPLSGDIECGLVFRESGTGELHTFALAIVAGVVSFQSRKWNSPTSFATGYLTNGFPIRFGSLIWMRIADNGTSRICSYSNDGRHFLPVHTVGRTDFLTADEVGIHMSAYGTAGTSEGYMTVLHYKEA